MLDVLGYVIVGIGLWLAIPTWINSILGFPLAALQGAFVRRSRRKEPNRDITSAPLYPYITKFTMTLSFCVTWLAIAMSWQLIYGDALPILLWTIVLIFNLISLADQNLTLAGRIGAHAEFRAILIVMLAVNMHLLFNHGWYKVNWF